MKTNLKRCAALLAAGCMAMGVFSGCAKKNEGNANGEVPTITYLVPSDPGHTFTNDTWAIKEWGKATGVNFEITSPPRDTFKEKLAALIASGNLPDMINYYQDSGADIYKTYGDKLFVSLDEYIEKGDLPNFKSWLDKYPEIRKKLSSKNDGKIYGFTHISDYNSFYSLWTVRNDLLKQGGWDADDIKTLDDLKEALLALQKVAGTPYITSSRLGWSYFALTTGIFFGSQPGMYYDNKFENGTNVWTYGPLTEAYRNWADFYRWMFENELLHPNFATMQQQELFAGYGDGSFTLCMEQATSGYMLGGADEKYPDREEKHIFPVEINGEVPKQALLSNLSIGYRWPVTITKNSKVIDDCLRAMDWLYGEEGISMMIRGKEGEHYVKDDNYITGIRKTGVQSSTTKRMVVNGEMTQEEFDKLPTEVSLGIGSGWLSAVTPANYKWGLDDKLKSEEEAARFTPNAINKFVDEGNVVDPNPSVVLNSDEKSMVADIITPIETFVSEWTIKYIMGQHSPEEWDGFVEKVKEMGIGKIVDLYNSKK
ncbi:MAG: extracellular solute-binding protein [Clostridia bacterium]|nr:extracellular solute-binding protein [Clostridia bacterium]